MTDKKLNSSLDPYSQDKWVTRAVSKKVAATLAARYLGPAESTEWILCITVVIKCIVLS